MTERYSHLIPDQKRKAVEGIGKAFQDVTETEKSKIVELKRFARK
ncbi:hypothetical protein DBT_0396 [Dissulfuribacter thermophilus]|uniref:Uncharacterized protein n=1 Tax=Dissulfuribacter thermophilus TaxID=1156395 RepID=A0A1B9F9J7_9BACT|nr:hypothetical protein [Dissulfuribacter thermophilus]OCC16578.1 hypothetical protein DBT_0396 [Dissulfuribacter thermophilus]